MLALLFCSECAEYSQAQLLFFMVIAHQINQI